MNEWLILLTLLIGGALLLAYINASGMLWAIGLIVILILISVLVDIAVICLVLIGLLVGLLVALILFDSLRKTYITQRILSLFQSQIPTMSSTEQEALEAGDTGWEGELFRGQPHWNKLKAYKLGLTDKEKAFIAGPVEALCALTNDWQITHELNDLSPETWQFIKDNKFFGVIIPEQFGGLGFSAQCHAAVISKLASRSITLAVTVMVPNSLGPGQLLLEYGTEAQRNKYLPRLASGAEIPCFALTSPEAGSDATGMVDSGIVCKQWIGGEEVLGIRLNWDKRYITLSPIATLLGLAFKLYDPEHLIGDKEDIGITLALIPTDTEGVQIGRRHMPGAVPFQNGPTQGVDVFIPVDWIIGGTDYAGKGWRMLVECLSEGRGVSLPALSVASAKLSTHVSTAYARVRQQFHNPIAKFEGVEEVLARIVGKTYLMQGANQLTLGMLDSGITPSVATAIVKYHLTEMMRDVINDAMDIHGGKGIMLGSSNYLMRIYQAIPISITVEGANILTRNMIIFGQGAMRCHPCLMDEIKAANDKDESKALDSFDKSLGRHVRHFMGSFSRAFLLGLTYGYLGKWEKGQRVISRLAAALSLSTEMALILVGGQLKRRERLSARLGDVLSYLYLASGAVLQFERNGCLEEERPLYDWSIDYCAYHAQEALYALAQNLPWFAGITLKRICFPLGRCFHLPTDKQDRTLVNLALGTG